MKCPKCNKKMVLCNKGIMYPTNPPQYAKEWRCGCGHTEPAPNEHGKIEEQLFMESWKKVNNIHKGD